MKTITILGDLSPDQFLRDFWHKKPLLIRGAITGLTPPLSRNELFSLAAQEDVESRLITQTGSNWKMENGPFAKPPQSSKHPWTLLVQGVNLHDSRADALLRQFNFLPEARLDDLMISVANDGGGVGPHFDSYDVFLLQAEGQRRWKISMQTDLTLIDGMPLKILKHFKPEQEFVLEPGDMLYLPPHVAHDGVAIGDCMTCSIGFRAPAFQELGEAFCQFMADSIDLPGRYADPDLKPVKRTAELSASMLQQIGAELKKVSFTREDITIFTGEYLSTPKNSVVFDAPKRALSPTKFLLALAERGLRLSLKTRMLYRAQHVFINGESFSVDGNDLQLLIELADTRELNGAALHTASQDLQETLTLWYEDGWVQLGPIKSKN